MTTSNKEDRLITKKGFVTFCLQYRCIGNGILLELSTADAFGFLLNDQSDAEKGV